MTDQDDSSSGTAGLAVEPDGDSGDHPEEPEVVDLPTIERASRGENETCDETFLEPTDRTITRAV